MNYFRYTFAPGMRLILLASFVLNACTWITVLSFGDWFAALMVFLGWVAMAAILMLISFFYYRTYKKFTNAQKQSHPWPLEVRRTED